MCTYQCPQSLSERLQHSMLLYAPQMQLKEWKGCPLLSEASCCYLLICCAPEVGASSASGLWPSLVLSHSGCSMAALCPPHAQWGNLQSWCPGSPVPSVDQGTGGRACCPAVSPLPPPPRSLQTMHHTLTGPALCPTHIYTHTRIWACTPPTQRSSPRSLTYTHVYTRCA